MLRNDPEAATYANKLRQHLRRSAQLDREEWRRLVEQGLAKVIARHDLPGLAALINVIVNELDAIGAVDESLAELSYAESMVGTDSDALAVILSLRASFLLAKGRAEESRAVMSRVGDLLERVHIAFARARAESTEAVVELVTFQPAAGELAEVCLSGERFNDDGDLLLVASWHIPYLFALGRRVEAHPWMRAMRLSAQNSGHAWRSGDAALFEAADRAGCQALPDGPVLPTPNHTARARWSMLKIHACLQFGRWNAAAAELRTLQLEMASLGEGTFGPATNFEAAVSAQRDGQLLPPPLFPAEVHLGNLASVLAGADAVATAGSQAEAGAWLAAWRASVPASVRTSLEWPASSQRLEGLLAARAGDVRLARQRLQQAAVWSETGGYYAEMRLAQLQLAELYSLEDFLVPETARVRLRREAWSWLRDQGIDPAPAAYAIARSAVATREAKQLSRLTPREVQVLQLLAEGCTYRGAADRLGIRWPTVQTLAHRIYEKLATSGRVEAINRARELGIL